MVNAIIAPDTMPGAISWRVILEKRLQGRAAQVHGRVPEGAVRLLEFRHDVQDHVGEVESDVGNEQRPEGQAGSAAPASGSPRRRTAGKGTRR